MGAGALAGRPAAPGLVPAHPRRCASARRPTGCRTPAAGCCSSESRSACWSCSSPVWTAELRAGLAQADEPRGRPGDRRRRRGRARRGPRRRGRARVDAPTPSRSRPVRTATSRPQLTRVNDAAPALALVDQTRPDRHARAFRGRPVLVTFAYAHCETVCPLVVADVMSLAAARPRRIARRPCSSSRSIPGATRPAGLARSPRLGLRRRCARAVGPAGRGRAHAERLARAARAQRARPATCRTRRSST